VSYSLESNTQRFTSSPFMNFTCMTDNLEKIMSVKIQDRLCSHKRDSTGGAACFLSRFTTRNYSKLFPLLVTWFLLSCEAIHYELKYEQIRLVFCCRYSSVGIDTQLHSRRQRNSGLTSDRGKSLCSTQHPGRLWGPSSILYRGEATQA
jgi:hypothetical protein